MTRIHIFTMFEPIDPGVVYLSITLMSRHNLNYISSNRNVSGGFSRNSHFLYLMGKYGALGDLID